MNMIFAGRAGSLFGLDMACQSLLVPEETGSASIPLESDPDMFLGFLDEKIELDGEQPGVEHDLGAGTVVQRVGSVSQYRAEAVILQGEEDLLVVDQFGENPGNVRLALSQMPKDSDFRIHQEQAVQSGKTRPMAVQLKLRDHYVIKRAIERGDLQDPHQKNGYAALEREKQASVLVRVGLALAQQFLAGIEDPIARKALNRSGLFLVENGEIAEFDRFEVDRWEESLLETGYGMAVYEQDPDVVLSQILNVGSNQQAHIDRSGQVSLAFDYDEMGRILSDRLFSIQFGLSSDVYQAGEGESNIPVFAIHFDGANHMVHIVFHPHEELGITADRTSMRELTHFVAEMFAEEESLNAQILRRSIQQRPQSLLGRP